MELNDGDFVNNSRKLHIQKGENTIKVAKYLNLVVSSSTLSGCQQLGEASTREMRFLILSLVPVFALVLNS